MGVGFQPCHRVGRPIIQPFGSLSVDLGICYQNKSFDIRRKGKTYKLYSKNLRFMALQNTTKTCGIFVTLFVLGRVVGSLLWLCSLDDPFIGTCASKTPSLEVDSFPPAALFLSKMYRFRFRVGWPWFNDVQCISISKLVLNQNSFEMFFQHAMKSSSAHLWHISHIYVLYCNLKSCKVMQCIFVCMVCIVCIHIYILYYIILYYIILYYIILYIILYYIILYYIILYYIYFYI